jgi:hypothetical protein
MDVAVGVLAVLTLVCIFVAVDLAVRAALRAAGLLVDADARFG